MAWCSLGRPADAQRRADRARAGFAAILLGIALGGCALGPEIRFLGSEGAAGAQVFVDGALVGTFSQRDSVIGIEGLPFAFKAIIRLQPEHDIVVITVAGDTLRAVVDPDDSGAVLIDAETRSIDYQ